MLIRLAENKDIPGLIALLKQVGQVHRDIRPDIFRPGCQKYDETALLQLLTDETRPIFVADDQGFVAGYCFCILRSYQNDGAMQDRAELYIDDLCVDENRRGQHIGSALYTHVLSYAREKGCQFVTLNVWQGNHSAMKFYENAGMTPRSITMEAKLC